MSGKGNGRGLFAFASIRPALLPCGKRGLRAAIRRIARPSSAFGRRSTENQKTTIYRRRSRNLNEERRRCPPLPGRPAKLARLCAKRTVKSRRTDRKISKLIFRLAFGFSSARKLSLRHSSCRRKLLVSGSKPVRPDGSRAHAGPGAELETAEVSNVPLQISACLRLFRSEAEIK